MAEIYVIKGWTPDAATAEIRAGVPCFAEGMVDAGYLQVRRAVRDALVRLGIPTIRPFTSAVLYCLYQDEVFKAGSIPDYHVSDVTHFLKWRKDREGSVPLPKGPIPVDLSNLEQRIHDHINNVNFTVTGRTSSSAPTIQDFFSSKLGKEPTMITKTPVFEKRVFINGVDASTLTDDQLFGLIEKLEQEASRLDMIQAKPQKLGKKITKLYKDIDRIKAYVDAR